MEVFYTTLIPFPELFTWPSTIQQLKIRGGLLNPLRGTDVCKWSVVTIKFKH